MEVVKAICSDCGGTGLYSGFMEEEGEYVVCVQCEGTGCHTIKYKPFKKRKGKRGVVRVRRGSGMILDDPLRKPWMSYEDFLKAIPSAD